jgi:hypothetical protein
LQSHYTRSKREKKLGKKVNILKTKVNFSIKVGKALQMNLQINVDFLKVNFFSEHFKTRLKRVLIRQVAIYLQSQQVAKSLFIFKGPNQRLFAKVSIGQVTIYLQSHHSASQNRLRQFRNLSSGDIECNT